MSVEVIFAIAGLILLVAPLGVEVRGIRLPALSSKGAKAASIVLGITLLLLALALKLNILDPQTATDRENPAVNVTNTATGASLEEGANVANAAADQTMPPKAAPERNAGSARLPPSHGTSTADVAGRARAVQRGEDVRGPGSVSATNGSVAIGGDVTRSNISARSGDPD
ncbi:MAG TPA: hypothetical protein VGB79_12465 [Allosphingosinicella sp.]